MTVISLTVLKISKKMGRIVYACIPAFTSASASHKYWFDVKGQDCVSNIRVETSVL